METLEKIVQYCKELNTFGALMINGEWGIGKTYLVEHELQENLKEEYMVVRISLFGSKSIDEIKENVQKACYKKLMDDMTQNRSDKKKLKELKNSMNRNTIFIFLELIKKANLPIIKDFQNLKLYECIPIEPTMINQKKLILIFDDLERCQLNTIEILGLINEYCENKGIKTIVITNEEKLEKGKEERTNYQEIKEKAIVRTLNYKPNYPIIINNIVKEYRTGINDDNQYKDFLTENGIKLLERFSITNIDGINLRSIKCAIQEFEIVFKYLKETDLSDEMNNFFLTFVSYLSEYRSMGHKEKISNSYLNKKYLGLYQEKYLLESLKKWIERNDWDYNLFEVEVKSMIEARKDTAPKDIIKDTELMNLDENIIEQGFKDYLDMVYSGSLTIDEYIILFENISDARTIVYEFPIQINLEELEKGVKCCLNKVLASDNPNDNGRRNLSEQNLNLLPQELEILKLIKNFKVQEMQMFRINKRKYIDMFNHNQLFDLYYFNDKKFNYFDEEMADAILKCYEKDNNYERAYIINSFERNWKYCSESPNMIIAESLQNFKYLKERLEALNVKEEAYKIKISRNNQFIEMVDKIIDSLETKNPNC